MRVEADINRTSDFDEVVLPLPSLLDTAAAEPLYQALNKCLLGASSVALDIELVEQISTSCVQLLLATARTARACGVPFRLCGVSAVTVEAIADLGLTQEFSLSNDETVKVNMVNDYTMAIGDLRS